MTRFQIESTAGLTLGVYSGETAEQAVAAMHADAGGTPEGDPMAGLIVTEATIAQCVLADSSDAAAAMEAAIQLGAEADQDWDAETTLYKFSDGSRMSVSGPAVELVA